MITGTLERFIVGSPVSDDGRVTLVIDSQHHDILTRDTDTDICCDGVGTRGSDVVAFLFDAVGPVDVMLWPPEDGGPILKATFTTGGVVT